MTYCRIHIAATCPKRIKDPPAKSSPASCVNFIPKCGSYIVKDHHAIIAV